MFRKILLAHDGSEGAERAMMVAIDLARRYGAELHLISIIEELPKYAATIDEVQEIQAEALRHYEAIQAQARRQAARQGVKVYDRIMPGHEVQTIVQYAEQGNFDVLVVGRQGHSAGWLKHLGSTSSQIAFYAPCTVMVVA
ncbi:MAG TPA: universal stress protein [Alphaproteobacteria bacterium]|nr:universal stress protein [Alphaproteobacteria bacterium]